MTGPFGAVAAYGSDACVACGNGTVPDASSSACASCAAGKYEGAGEVCITCPDDWYSIGGNVFCEFCGHGHTTNAGTLQFVCSSCAPGRFEHVTDGVAGCVQCPVGWMSPSGALNCTSCSVGERVNAGQTACDACVAGRFQDGTASASCKICPEDWYSASGNWAQANRRSQEFCERRSTMSLSLSSFFRADTAT